MATERIRPTHPSVNKADDPPELTNGSGIPVTGMSPVTAAMFITAWTPIMIVRPPATSLANRSEADNAILIPAHTSTPNAAMTEMVPSSPSSSPMIAKMKSVCAAGR